MKQFGLVFEASAQAGGRLTESAGVEATVKLKRPKLVKIESAGQKRRREKRELRERMKTFVMPPMKRPVEDEMSWRAAMRVDPLVDCSRCHVILRESTLVGGLCEACAYGGDE